MRNSLMKLMLSTLVMSMLVVAFLPLSSAVPASAPAPDWQQGDQWGYSSKVYIDPSDSNVTDAIEEAVNTFDGSLEKMVFNASMESYIYVKVVEETTDQYILMAVFCSEMTAYVDIKVKASMPVEGVYDILTEVPKENKTIRLNLNMDYLIYQSTNLTLDKDSLAIKEVDSHNELSFSLDLVLDNIYSQEMEGLKQNITYNDYDVSIDLSTFLNLTLDFAPALNVYDFPLAVGDEWEVSSIATLTGDLSGKMDAQGLPDEALSEISDQNKLDFPLDLSEYNGELGGLTITNGTIEEVSEEIDADLKCTRMLEIADDDVGNGTIQIFEVSVNQGEVLFYYSPDLGFFHGMDASSALVTDNLDSIGGLSIPTEEEEMMTMEYQPAPETAKKIESLSGHEVDGITNQEDDQGGMPYLFAGVVVALAALAVIVGVVMYRRKKKSG